MLKLIFMGTPEFACPALQKLIEHPEFEVVAVYTKEPNIAGRGHKITNSPIHDLALKNNLPVITPKDFRDPNRQQEFINFQADVAVVVAYGLILPGAILQGTKYGCVNIHPSILPRWRGAAPIQRTIMAGDQESGVAIIKMDQGVDSGDVLIQEKFALNDQITSKDLADRCSILGAELLISALQDIQNNQLVSTKQDNSRASYAKKIDKSECLIDWHKSAEEIDRKIRGLNGSLGSYFILADEKIKIYQAEIISLTELRSSPGSILDGQMMIQCRPGIIRPKTLQRPGKKVMDIEEFLKGFPISQHSLS